VTEIQRMKSASPVLYGVIKIEWLDGFVGLVDIRNVLSTLPMFEFLKNDKQRFNQMQMEEYGHKLFWLDDDGDAVDLGSASLRERAERQSEILRLAS
jgi:hypothetical protein